jgi:hypothetical protein
MALTLQDITDKLKQLDEVTVLEILELTSEDLVNTYIDIIEDKIDKLEELFDDTI